MLQRKCVIESKLEKVLTIPVFATAPTAYRAKRIFHCLRIGKCNPTVFKPNQPTNHPFYGHYTGQPVVDAKFYCLHALADGNQRIRIRETTLEFSSTVLSALSSNISSYCKLSLHYLCPLVHSTQLQVQLFVSPCSSDTAMSI